MLFIILVINIFFSNLVFADIFKLNDSSANHDVLNNAIAQDSAGLYFKDGHDINITSTSKGPFNYQLANINPAIPQKFNYAENFTKQVNKPFLNGQSAAQWMQSIRASGLLEYQYTSPAEVDLLKFYATLGQMRLNMFYEQARDLEKEFGGPLEVLRRQGLYDCLKSSPDKENLPQQVIDCTNRKDYFDALFKSERIAGDRLVVIDEVFNRLNLRDSEIIDQVKGIVPDWILLRNGYQLNGPKKRIGQVFADYREYFINRLKEILSGYIQEKEVSGLDLEEFALPSAQLTAQQLRDLLMFNEQEQEIIISKWGAYWAGIKTISQYQVAIEYLDRALMHPLVKAGFKSVVKEDRQFLDDELCSFKEQVNTYKDYASYMASVELEVSKRKALWQGQVKDDHDE